MLYIVHGEDISKSRALVLNQQKKLQIDKRVELNLAETNPNELKQILLTPNIFGEFSYVVINISKIDKSALDSYIEILQSIPKECTVIVLAETELPATNPFIKNAKNLNARIILNSVEVKSNMFKFIDCLVEKNRPATYKELQQLTAEGTDDFYIFTMILYALRNITALITESPSIENMKPFVKTKVTKQAKAYTLENIKTLYRDLYTIDKGVKTGQVAPELFVTLSIEKVLNA